MQLTLIRHGEAIPAVHGQDTKRPLSPRGHAQAQQTAEFVASKIQPDLFVVSPLLRAQETLIYLQHKFPQVPVLLCDAIKPEDDAAVAVEWLSKLPYESIVVVCHMNVVAYMEEILLEQYFNAFALAEARIYQQPVIARGLSIPQVAFVPSV
ncbi:phosphoglycerate mutase family protein [Acinetobacter sp. MD2]|uniref:phosphoglycerate mutase family protein n=1 Tax=Acinetobacter sp. MD2 TaxID=2600066 RepID=UPI002D1EA9C4|nr:phosphoglycerate mutase family protein [Acinetobacter sp. MD2]MEB3766400.1 histidine phosphatase family protein [Acinetobacter sp. MD2]